MFRFKQFSVAQDRCAMKVGTDGVLLGAWAKAAAPLNILDIGTGTGLIALMLAQRFPKAQLTALEIDAAAAAQAQTNFEQSPWPNRLQAIHTSLQSFKTTKAFDLIVSNPPYFENVSKAKDSERTQARHTDSLPFEALISHSAALLSKNGTIALILPIEVKERVVKIALENGLFLQELCAVKGNESAKSKRVLLQFGFQKTDTTIQELTIEISRHQYTDEYIQLCKAFYLKM